MDLAAAGHSPPELAAISQAVRTMKPGFRNSDGCTEAKPKLNQRTAPLPKSVPNIGSSAKRCKGAQKAKNAQTAHHGRRHHRDAQHRDDRQDRRKTPAVAHSRTDPARCAWPRAPRPQAPAKARRQTAAKIAASDHLSIVRHQRGRTGSVTLYGHRAIDHLSHGDTA